MLKKTESVTYRTDMKIKAALSVIAAEKKWSISQLTEEIIRQWLQENRPELLEQELTAYCVTPGALARRGIPAAFGELAR